MKWLPAHVERHYAERIGWLRAAVMGANDGIVSTASLIVGVAAAQAGAGAVLTAGAAGLIAGAMSMAAGEYVSVSSQAETERADLRREAAELRDDPTAELAELAAIYRSRGVAPDLAREVAAQLSAHDALATHAREELGITEISSARPLQAALASAITFAVGAGLPLAVAIIAPADWTIPAVALTALAGLAALGALGAYAGGANSWRGALRVSVWGSLALALTTLFGTLAGSAGL